MESQDAVNMAAVLNEVAVERFRQEKKWGRQDHAMPNYLMILGEEVGEANKECLEEYFNRSITKKTYKNLREELIQVAAVAVAMVECLDRQNETT